MTQPRRQDNTYPIHRGSPRILENTYIAPDMYDFIIALANNGEGESIHYSADDVQLIKDAFREWYTLPARCRVVELSVTKGASIASLFGGDEAWIFSVTEEYTGKLGFR